MPEPEFDPVYNECIERLGEFTNVRNITIHFDRHASGNHSSYGEIFQDSEFQPRWLSRILRSVDACNHATELAVRHYENTLEPNNEVPLLFESVAKLTSLRLSIKHEETNRLSVGPTYRVCLIHEDGGITDMSSFSVPLPAHTITDISSVETSILSGTDFLPAS